MASFKHTFTSGQTITPARLNDARDVFDIVNADVKSNAAIVGTKIAPNFGSQNVVTAGTELVGAATAPTGNFVYSSTVSSAGARQTVVTGHATGSASSAVVRYSNNTTSAAFMAMLKLAKSNTQTVGDHVAVVDDQPIGGVAFMGSDGTNFVSGAEVLARVDGAVTTNSVPMRLIFATKGVGSTGAPSERMRIQADGNVGIANTAPTERLHVTGNIKASGFIDADISFRGQATDSAAAPSFTFTGDTDTGMFRVAANVLAFSVDAVEKLRINASGVVTPNDVTAARLVAEDGTFSLPSITFSGDLNTGIFHPSPDTIAFCEGGVERMRINSLGQVGIGIVSPAFQLDVNGFVNTASAYRVDGGQVVGNRRLGWSAPGGTATRTTFATASVTLPQLAERVHALIDDLIAHGLIGPTPP